MDKIDLIIDALEQADRMRRKQGYTEEYLQEALAAARELRELKPVAWETVALKFANDKRLSYGQPKQLPDYLSCRPLYALDEVKHD